MKIALRRVSRPESTIPVERPTIPVAEYEARSDALYASAGLDWLAVYGDREHNANLLFLTNFDPRFEEGLLLLGPGGRRVLLVGNEGLTHVKRGPASGRRPSLSTVQPHGATSGAVQTPCRPASGDRD